MSYKEISKRKVAERDALFKKEWLVPEEKLPGPEVLNVIDWPSKSGFLSSSEVVITESHPLIILQKIKVKEWTAFEVASAFGHRATIAHQLTNCLTEIFFDEGLERAKELDEFYAKTGELKGPYHGLPISLKDNIVTKGHAASIGFACYAYDPPAFEKDCVVAEALRGMGAVFYCKTNIPTAMMMPESTNHLWGTTLNPFNRNLTCGGSSGGEGALVAMKGSAMGIGNDIGGSLRIPAGFQNLYTLRTTSGRFPSWGNRGALVGIESVVAATGPMTTTLDMLDMYAKLITNTGLENKDPKMVPYGWRDVDLPEKLTFGICWEDHMMHPWPSVQRGMKLVVDKLRKLGHEVVEWDAAEHADLCKCSRAFFTSDGGAKVKELVSRTDEPFYEYMHFYRDAPEISVAKLWDMQAQRAKLVLDVIDRWEATKLKTSSGKPIDAILMPVAPYSAAPLGEMRSSCYTNVWNVADFPAGTVPVTVSDRYIDLKEDGYKPYSTLDQKCYDAYDPEKCHGGPVAVQVVGRKLEDEKVLKMMRVVAEAVDTEKYWFK